MRSIKKFFIGIFVWIKYRLISLWSFIKYLFCFKWWKGKRQPMISVPTGHKGVGKDFKELEAEKPKYVDAHERYLTISMENKTDKDQYIELFSFSYVNLPEGVKLRYLELEGNIMDALVSLKSGKRIVAGLRYIVENSIAQLNIPIDIKTVSPFGYITSMPFRPYAYRTAYQNLAYQIDAPNYRFKLNDETRIGVKLLPNTEATLVLQIIEDESFLDKFKKMSSGIIN